MRRYHYLLTITTLVGYLTGPLLAWYLLGIIRPLISYLIQTGEDPDLWLIVNPEIWTPACRIFLILYLFIISKTAHKYFEWAAGIVLKHNLSFYRWRDRICTPGTVLDYLLWAYSYAIIRNLTEMAAFWGTWIIFPLKLGSNAAWQLILAVPFFLIALIVPHHILLALDEIYMAVPKKLGTNLQMVGPLIDFLLARDEEAEASLPPQ